MCILEGFGLFNHLFSQVLLAVSHDFIVMKCTYLRNECESNGFYSKFTGVLITTWPPMNCKNLNNDLPKPQNKHHKKRYKNVTHCFIFSGKELPIIWLTIS